jgi:hypothetical protein
MTVSHIHSLRYPSTSPWKRPLELLLANGSWWDGYVCAFGSSTFRKALIISNRPGYPWHSFGCRSRSAKLLVPPIALV